LGKDETDFSRPIFSQERKGIQRMENDYERELEHEWINTSKVDGYSREYYECCDY